ncbi:hypothetical protein ACQP3F_31960, partial [Escherichia coli]
FIFVFHKDKNKSKYVSGFFDSVSQKFGPLVALVSLPYHSCFISASCLSLVTTDNWGFSLFGRRQLNIGNLFHPMSLAL